MTWHYQNKANQALPLKSESIFDVKWKNVKSPKDASLQVIFVNHPIVKTRSDVEYNTIEHKMEFTSINVPQQHRHSELETYQFILKNR
jgi:hypothetical protein